MFVIYNWFARGFLSMSGRCNYVNSAIDSKMFTSRAAADLWRESLPNPELCRVIKLEEVEPVL